MFVDNNIEGVGVVCFFMNGVNSVIEGVDVVVNYMVGIVLNGDLSLSLGVNYNNIDVSDVVVMVGFSDLFEFD